MCNEAELSPQVIRQNEDARAEQIMKMQTENVIQTGSVITRGERRIFVTSVIGQVEGHFLSLDRAKTTKYEHVLPLIASVEENELIDGALFLVNTMGGDVEAGLAIGEMIGGMKKPTASLILGGSHSIGVPIAVAAKKSFIAPSATMTLHPVRTNGLVVGVEQSFSYFKAMQNRIVDFITGHSSVNREKLLELIMATDEIATDMGTVVGADEAVECGLIDAVGSFSDAISFIKGECPKETC